MTTKYLLETFLLSVCNFAYNFLHHYLRGEYDFHFFFTSPFSFSMSSKLDQALLQLEQEFKLLDHIDMTLLVNYPQLKSQLEHITQQNSVIESLTLELNNFLVALNILDLWFFVIFFYGFLLYVWFSHTLSRNEVILFFFLLVFKFWVGYQISSVIFQLEKSVTNQVDFLCLFIQNSSNRDSLYTPEISFIVKRLLTSLLFVIVYILWGFLR